MTMSTQEKSKTLLYNVKEHGPVIAMLDENMISLLLEVTAKTDAVCDMQSAVIKKALQEEDLDKAQKYIEEEQGGALDKITEHLVEASNIREVFTNKLIDKLTKNMEN